MLASAGFCLTPKKFRTTTTVEPYTRYQPTGFSQPTALKRKPHRKSRTGCSECKRRRIKVRSRDGALPQPNPAQCDQEKPRYTYCVCHERPCVYLGTLAALGTITRSQPFNTCTFLASVKDIAGRITHKIVRDHPTFCLLFPFRDLTSGIFRVERSSAPAPLEPGYQPQYIITQRYSPASEKASTSLGHTIATSSLRLPISPFMPS